MNPRAVLIVVGICVLFATLAAGPGWALSVPLQQHTGSASHADDCLGTMPPLVDHDITHGAAHGDVHGCAAALQGCCIAASTFALTAGCRTCAVSASSEPGSFVPPAFPVARAERIFKPPRLNS